MRKKNINTKSMFYQLHVAQRQLLRPLNNLENRSFRDRENLQYYKKTADSVLLSLFMRTTGKCNNSYAPSTGLSRILLLPDAWLVCQIIQKLSKGYYSYTDSISITLRVANLFHMVVHYDYICIDLRPSNTILG